MRILLAATFVAVSASLCVHAQEATSQAVPAAAVNAAPVSAGASPSASSTSTAVPLSGASPSASADSTAVPKATKIRVFMQSQSHGNNWNARRDQSMEMSKDFENDCPGVKITLNQQNADYTVSLNHIEVGLFGRDNQVQVADRNGDLLTRTKEGGSIKGAMKKACAAIMDDYAKNAPPQK